MLPFEDDNENGGGDYPFDESNFNEGNIQFDDYAQATEFFDAVSDYMHDEGFSNQEWFSMATEIHEFSTWYDDDGGFHYYIDFDWWCDDCGDGGYGGHASASG